MGPSPLPLPSGEGTTPLAGVRVLVTRAREQASELVGLLEASGAMVVELPTIAIAPPEDLAALDAAVRRGRDYDWVVFTSANAVRFIAERTGALDGGAAWPRVAAVGAATAEALTEVGIRVDWAPRQASGAALAAEMPIALGERVLFPRSDLANPELPRALAARGARVDEVVAYRTVPRTGPAPEVQAALASGEIDAVLLASPSSARGLASTCGAEPALYRRAAIVAIGPTTAQAIRQLGLPVAAEAREQSARGLVEALVNWRGRRDA